VSTAKTPKLGAATLNASGSTFQLPFEQQAIAAFKKVQPAVTINYAGGGSGTGRQNFSDQVVDFAGTDGLFTAAAAAAAKGGAFSYIPFIAGPIVVAYNLPGVKKLQLSPSTIAKIFSRAIKTWNDPAIAADNPGVTLPSTAITVGHRSDSSGTTQQFTGYLVKAAPADWKLGTGGTVPWPSDTQGGAANSGVAAIVKGTAGAIGYVDYSDARALNLTFAAVKNKAGKFITPSIAAVTAALQDPSVTLNPDGTYDPLDSAAAKAYPIASPTWIVVYNKYSDAAKAAAIRAYLTFILSKDGQKLAPQVDYAPLPASYLKAAQAKVNAIQG
jgi:phosphate transport system substrate-binding protein